MVGMICGFVRSVIVVVAVTLLLGFGAPVSASDDRVEAPMVGERYQAAVDAAWDKAGAGEDPSMTCARVKGTVAGTGDPDAFRALFACNVEIPARYFDTYLDSVAAGEKTCQSFMMEIMTKLSAMTMSADLVVEMAEKLEQGADTETVVVDALGDAAAGSMTDDGLKDPKRLVKDRIAERTNELCPDFASVILN
jgi:hypothetical protein